MRVITVFYLRRCPYCRDAQRALDELRAEGGMEGISLNWIEESENPQLAGSYDYYYVPSFFLGEEKLYECSPADGYDRIKAGIREALNRVR